VTVWIREFTGTSADGSCRIDAAGGVLKITGSIHVSNGDVIDLAKY
jgi:hypothetical protein